MTFVKKMVTLTNRKGFSFQNIATTGDFPMTANVATGDHLKRWISQYLNT